MIFDVLSNSALYSGLPCNLASALKFLMETDLSKLDIGRTDIDGDNLYALVQEYYTRPLSEGKWEAHRKYIDIQYMEIGMERMGFANLSQMQLGEFEYEKDSQPMSGKGNFVDVFAGSFVIFFPDDGHMPGLCVDSTKQIRKIVIKVKIN